MIGNNYLEDSAEQIINNAERRAGEKCRERLQTDGYTDRLMSGYLQNAVARLVDLRDMLLQELKDKAA